MRLEMSRRHEIWLDYKTSGGSTSRDTNECAERDLIHGSWQNVSAERPAEEWNIRSWSHGTAHGAACGKEPVELNGCWSWWVADTCSRVQT